jgi:indole-3-glycerol phosphate synthase
MGFPLIIAEVKTHSPFGFQSDKSWDELFEIAENIGDIISIHTDPRWNGSMELIRKARSLTTKPILAKGIHATDKEIKEAIAAGAEHVLVVGRIPKIHVDRCLIEALSLEELTHIPNHLKVVWNSRDLNTGGLKKQSYADARKIFTGWLCQASNITTVKDIKQDADAILIGTHLVEFAQSLRDKDTPRSLY